MRIALAGRPGSGKSTLFDLVAGAGHPGSGLRIAHVQVPDARIDALSAAFKPRKTTHARIELQDLEQKSGPTYPALSPERREMLGKSDLILLLVDLFSEPVEAWGKEVAGQIGQVCDELAILDLATVESRLERVEKMVRSGQKPGFAGEPEILAEFRDLLNAGKPLSEHPASVERAKDLRGFAFLSMRPILPAFNVSEDQLAGARERLAEVSELAREPGAIVLCAEVEKQIQELPPEDRDTFMEAFGLRESALLQTIRSAYAQAGLISFFTVGEDEVRAWSLRRGSTAPQAAGVIHTDLEKGFVRAEVVAYADWEQSRSMAKVKEQGRARLEGKEYVVQDGDILNIRSGLAKSKG